MACCGLKAKGTPEYGFADGGGALWSKNVGMPRYGFAGMGEVRCASGARNAGLWVCCGQNCRNHKIRVCGWRNGPLWLRCEECQNTGSPMDDGSAVAKSGGMTGHGYADGMVVRCGLGVKNATRSTEGGWVCCGSALW
ncbi:hypothetical protein Aduo_002113 [Ancylostoma duodenale]